jgi:hypothetical protein
VTPAALLALIAAAGALVAQPAEDEPGTFRLSGRVVSVAGVPLPGAIVHLSGEAPSGEQSQTESGADGRFEFLNLPRGRCYLEITKPGFIPAADMVWLHEKDVLNEDIVLEARPRAGPPGKAAGSERLTIEHIGGDGRVAITLSDGSTFVPLKEDYQAGVSEPAISDNRRAAGWLVEYWSPFFHSGQSRPLKLVIYRPGKALRRFSARSMFWSWWFVDDGKQVGYCENFPHPFGAPPLCELRDIKTGRRIDRYVPKGDQPPEWATDVPE